jgi:hypothetical protein
MQFTSELGSGGIMYIPSFVKINTELEEILRFFFSSLKGCNFCINDDRDFLITPLKLAQLA